MMFTFTSVLSHIGHWTSTAKRTVHKFVLSDQERIKEKNILDEPRPIIYNSAISIEAEITDENDLTESGRMVEAPQETIVQMDR